MTLDLALALRPDADRARHTHPPRHTKLPYQRPSPSGYASGSVSQVDTPRSRQTAIREVAPNFAPPPGNPRFPLFDSLRAIAALSVFVGHVVMATHPLAGHPTAFLEAGVAANGGVAIFFLISGFLLYRPFLVARRAGRSLTLRDYARRRIVRIVPAYWVALTLFLLAGLISGVTASNWWIFYGFGQIYSFNTLGGGIGVAWTLCIEVTFYALLPVFALAGAKLARRPKSVDGDLVLLAILAAGSLIFRVHYGSNFSNVWILSTLPATFFWFALGMGLAIASVAQDDRHQAFSVTRLVTNRPALCWGAALVLFVVSYETSRASATTWTTLATFVLRGLAALFVLLPGVFGDTAAGLVRHILRRRALSWIGLVSYAFYLYHPVVIARVIKVLPTADLRHSTLAVLMAAFLGSCVCAAASYYLVERPIMRTTALPSPERLLMWWRKPS